MLVRFCVSVSNFLTLSPPPLLCEYFRIGIFNLFVIQNANKDESIENSGILESGKKENYSDKKKSFKLKFKRCALFVLHTTIRISMHVRNGIFLFEKKFTKFYFFLGFFHQKHFILCLISNKKFKFNGQFVFFLLFLSIITGQ